MRSTIARMSTIQFAFDKQSSRTRDADGRMRVKNCILSTSEVNPYNGKEIPGWKDLGLDPDKVYHLYRTPELLEKAVPTAEGIPLMVKHIPNTANEPNHDYKGGSIHTIKFDGKHLRGDLLVDDARAIDLIESGKQADLSLGYRYKPVMRPGKSPDGHDYDGEMHHEGGANHLALVDDGRATGAHVNDHAHQPITGDAAMPQPAKKVENAENRDDPTKNTPAATDPAVATTTPAAAPVTNEQLGQIGQALKHIAELLEDLHGRLPGSSNGDDPMNANDNRRAKDNEHEEAEDRKRAHDEELDKRYQEDRRRRAYDKARGAMDAKELEGETEDKKRAHDEEMKARGAEDKRREAYDAEFEPIEVGSQEGTPARGEKTPHGAMDAKSVSVVVEAAVLAERTRATAAETARRDVRDVLGDVYGLDNAGDIYLAALKEKGVDVTAIAKETAHIAWNAYRAATVSARPAGYAMDANAGNDAATANQKSLLGHLSKISVKG